MFAVALLLAAATAASAQDPESDAQRLYSRVMSPYCQGLLLADCPSPDAFTLRAEVRRRLEDGETAASIEADLYHRFGDSIRAMPAATGSGRWLWVLPAIAFGLSLSALLWFLLHANRALRAPPIAAAVENPELDDRLEEELERLG